MRSRLTVLVVEDDYIVRRIVRRMLQRNGFDTVEARDGLHALEVASAHEGEIAVLVTDVRMPGLKGPQLAAQLRASRPGIRVLYMSGHPREALDELPAGSEIEFIAKPFGGRELAEKVRQILLLGN